MRVCLNKKKLRGRNTGAKSRNEHIRHKGKTASARAMPYSDTLLSLDFDVAPLNTLTPLGGANVCHEISHYVFNRRGVGVDPT